MTSPTLSEQASAKIKPPVAPVADEAPEYQPPKFKPGQIVPEEDVHSALEFLRDSAFKIGKASERERKAEYDIKTQEAFGYQMAEGASEFRKACARTSQKYQDATVEHAKAFGDLRRLYALREAASLVVDVWRSQEASLRKAAKL